MKVKRIRSFSILFSVLAAALCAGPATGQPCRPSDFDLQLVSCGGANPDLDISRNDCDEATSFFVRAAAKRLAGFDYGEFKLDVGRGETGLFELTGLEGRASGNTAYQVTISENPGYCPGASCTFGTCNGGPDVGKPCQTTLTDSPEIIAVVEGECPSSAWQTFPTLDADEAKAIAAVLKRESVVGALGVPFGRDCLTGFDISLVDLDNRARYAYNGIAHGKYICGTPRSSWSGDVDNCCVGNPDPRCADRGGPDQNGVAIEQGYAIAADPAGSDLFLDPGEHIHLRGVGNFPFCCDEVDTVSIYCGGFVVFSVKDPDTGQSKTLSPPIWSDYATDVGIKDASSLTLGDVRIRCIDFETPNSQDFTVVSGGSLFFGDENHNGVDDLCGSR